MSGSPTDFPKCPVCDEALAQSIGHIVFLPCAFRVHVMHSGCLAVRLNEAKDKYRCPVCVLSSTQDPAQEVEGITKKMYPLVQDEYRWSKERAQHVNLSLFTTERTKLGGQDYFVEKWLINTSMGMWQRIVPMGAPRQNISASSTQGLPANTGASGELNHPKPMPLPAKLPVEFELPAMTDEEFNAMLDEMIAEEASGNDASNSEGATFSMTPS